MPGTTLPQRALLFLGAGLVVGGVSEALRRPSDLWWVVALVVGLVMSAVASALIYREARRPRE